MVQVAISITSHSGQEPGSSRFKVLSITVDAAEKENIELVPQKAAAGYMNGYADPEFIKELEQRFGFDQPLHVRFLRMIRSYVVFDFGESFFRDRKVVDLVLEKMPVSISLGVWTTLLVYLISIPLGVAKAVRDGSRFDIGTSFVLVVGYADDRGTNRVLHIAAIIVAKRHKRAADLKTKKRHWNH